MTNLAHTEVTEAMLIRFRKEERECVWSWWLVRGPAKQRLRCQTNLCHPQDCREAPLLQMNVISKLLWYQRMGLLPLRLLLAAATATPHASASMFKEWPRDESSVTLIVSAPNLRTHTLNRSEQ